MFTGDRSGDFLYKALHKAGFANQSASENRDDGLRLESAYITATCRCAPPDNKPLPKEIANCSGYFERELEILRPVAVLALGKIAWDGYLEVLKQRGLIASRALYKFAQGAEAEVAPGTPRLFGVYHPSQQNTQTGRVTPAMYAAVLRRIRRFLEGR
jgi:uracil-DNA glycosylase family 4